MLQIYSFSKYFVTSMGITAFLLLSPFSHCNTIAPPKNPDLPVSVGMDPSWHGLHFEGHEENMYAYSCSVLHLLNTHFHVIRTEQMEAFLSSKGASRHPALLVECPTVALPSQIWSVPIFPTGHVLVVQKEDYLPNQETFLTTWKGNVKIVAAQQGIDLSPLLRHLPEVLIKEYEEIRQAYEDLDAGKVDALYDAAFFAHIACNSVYKNKLLIATSPLDTKGICILMKGCYQGDINLLNQRILQLEKDGTLEALRKEWGLPHVPYPKDFVFSKG